MSTRSDAKAMDDFWHPRKSRQVRRAISTAVFGVLCVGAGLWFSIIGLRALAAEFTGTAHVTGYVEHNPHVARHCSMIVSYEVDGVFYHQDVGCTDARDGDPIAITYNPHHPELSVESGWRGWGWALFWTASGLVVLAGGVLFLSLLRHPMRIGVASPRDIAEREALQQRLRDVGLDGNGRPLPHDDQGRA